MIQNNSLTNPNNVTVNSRRNEIWFINLIYFISFHQNGARDDVMYISASWAIRFGNMECIMPVRGPYKYSNMHVWVSPHTGNVNIMNYSLMMTKWRAGTHPSAKWDYWGIRGDVTFRGSEQVMRKLLLLLLDAEKHKQQWITEIGYNHFKLFWFPHILSLSSWASIL